MSSAPLPSLLTLETAMKRAILEGQKGWGLVAPNPLVGCVVLNSQHELLAVGHHTHLGGPHAEVHALQNVPYADLVGAHVVVTLEPCAHYGRTPPCAEMLAKLPIQSVTYGVLDPNPKVSGQGLEILRAAGKDVIHLKSFEKQCEELAEIFLYSTRYKKPFVSLKVAMSADEAIASKNRTQQLWLTNEISVLHVHYLRAQYDAILVGKNTVLQDNPQLNIRHPDFLDHENKVIILDPAGELLERKDLNVWKYHSPENIFFACEKQEGPQILTVPRLPTGSLDLNAVLDQAYHKGIRSIFVEGGAQTFRAFLQQKLVQRFYIFKTPHRLFEEGLHWNLNFQNVENLDLQSVLQENFGDNLFLTGVCVK